VALLAVACRGGAARSAAVDLVLPSATHGISIDEAAPTITVTDGDVRLDKARVDDARALDRCRSDALYQELFRSKPALVAVRLDRGAHASLVKGVLGTAAAAGSTHAYLIVRVPSRGERAIEVDLRTPRSGLSLQVRPEACDLAWGGSRRPAVGYEQLAAAVRDEWTAHGAHRAIDDTSFDDANIEARDDVDYATLVRAIDAVLDTKREWHEPGSVNRDPALVVHLALGDHGAPCQAPPAPSPIPRCIRAGGTCVGPAAIQASPASPCPPGMRRVDDVTLPGAAPETTPACLGIPFGEEACCMPAR
jgi:hypothetical protein